MQFVRTLPGRSSTSFYFTESGNGGLHEEQQEYIADLVMSYRARYRILEINAVWDFGMEDGDPVRNEKYGVFAQTKDNAVYNARLGSISLNHVRVRGMPCEVSASEIANIMADYRRTIRLPVDAERAGNLLLSQGVPWPEIGNRVREILTAGEMGEGAREHLRIADFPIYKEEDVTPERENFLPLTDPYFPDVQAIRRLENTESIRRLLIHEIGHLLSEESGAVSRKAMKRLFGRCRDGFENLYEFCAECFMAGELTSRERIALAAEYRKIHDGTG